MNANPAAVYLKAADIVRSNGHNKGAYFTRPETGVGIDLAPSECPVCIAGAVSLAMFGWPVPSGEEGRREEFDATTRRLVELMDVEGDPLLEPVGRLAAWNDMPERTVEDVIAALEQAAREAVRAA
ncbi:hypothetical protein [Streptomyces sp. NPDC097640]|uniref:DUF6197 family protein n=1 Tax=Streptomyces sp. NPDC097640 TaxID=3157229 RepID=UPI0033277597